MPSLLNEFDNDQPVDPISLDPYEKPTRILQCGHTFNQSSLADIIAKNSSNTVLICPVCRERNPLRAADAYPRNYSLEHHLDFKEQQDKAVEVEKVTRKIATTIPSVQNTQSITIKVDWHGLRDICQMPFTKKLKCGDIEKFIRKKYNLYNHRVIISRKDYYNIWDFVKGNLQACVDSKLHEGHTKNSKIPNALLKYILDSKIFVDDDNVAFLLPPPRWHAFAKHKRPEFIQRFEDIDVKVKDNIKPTMYKDNKLVKIRDETGNPYIRLLHKGRQLEDGRTLSDYTKKSSEKMILLHVVLRLRGGMYHWTSGRMDNLKVGETVTHKIFLCHDNGKMEQKVVEINISDSKHALSYMELLTIFGCKKAKKEEQKML
eukprot:g11957.t1